MTAHWLAPAGLHTAAARLPFEGEMPALGGATGWLNSPPLTPDGLRGKVVLVSFWTYTCINWLRQLPYVRAWADKYSGPGLVVIGVHTPEFPFEHDPDNVRRAVHDLHRALVNVARAGDGQARAEARRIVAEAADRLNGLLTAAR